MPVFIPMLLGGIISIAGSLVGRVLIGLGIGFVAYTGMSVALGNLQTQALTYISALPPQIIGMLGMMKVGTALQIIVSALIARLTIAGLTSGVMRKMVFGVGDIRRAGG